MGKFFSELKKNTEFWRHYVMYGDWKKVRQNSVSGGRDYKTCPYVS